MATSQQGLAAFVMSSEYPDPLIVPPKQLPHKQSFIILHGRGSNAHDFAAQLLLMQIPGMGTLADAFPHARFVFPSASMRRAQVMKGLPISQWFDNWNLRNPEERPELQIEGLRETSEWVHILITREVEHVGASNVTLGGLSQGCAASLIAHMLWGGERLAAVLGMCGWLPVHATMLEGAGLGGWEEHDEQEFQKEIDEITRTQRGSYDNGLRAQIEREEQSLKASSLKKRAAIDPSHGSQAHRVEMENVPRSDSSPMLPSRAALGALRDYLSLATCTGETLSFESTPMFIGHGWLDPKVPVSLGRKAAYLFKRISRDVTYTAYEGLGHWYSPSMLGDIVNFIREKTEWEHA